MDLSGALRDCHEIVKACPTCGFFTGQAGCAVCSEQGRDTQVLCVVEQPTDVLPIERSGVFRGLYHCLGGKLSPLDDVRPEDLRIGGLVRRVRENPGTEVILATSSDVEGEATANYLCEVLASTDCQVTRLAQGLPAGGGLEFADELTLSRAFEGRR
jgi:recombination protein RecR